MRLTHFLRILMKRRNRQLAAALALVAVVAVVLVIVLSNGSSPNGGSGQTPSYSGTVMVQRRNLVSTDTESGTLSYANPQTVYNRLSGTITWLPSAGRLIKPGHALFDVDNAPVLLMSGKTPAFRDLTSSDSDGPDILELNQNLVELGYDPDGIVVDDTWQAGTTAGVEALQKAEGQDETGTLALGQVVFLPGAQLVATVAGTVGSTGGGGTSASLSDPLSHAEFVSDTTTSTDAATTGTTTAGTSATGTSATGTSTDATGTSTTETGTTGTTGTAPTTTTTKTGGSSGSKTLAKELAALKAELAAVKAQLRTSASKAAGSGGNGTRPSGGSGGSGGSDGSSGSGGSGGSGGGSTTEILTTNSTQLVVTVDLNASLQSEATLGEKVSVEMPDGSTVDGRVTAVSSVAQSSDSGDSGAGSGGGNGSGNGGGSGGSGTSATVPITITLDRQAKGAWLDQASVSVDFTQAKASNVLSIPVTSLIATSGQKFAVQEAVAPYKLIPVTTGLFAAGYVQISGSGVYQGLEITDSQG